jgi:hypothetical protein
MIELSANGMKTNLHDLSVGCFKIVKFSNPFESIYALSHQLSITIVVILPSNNIVLITWPFCSQIWLRTVVDTENLISDFWDGIFWAIWTWVKLSLLVSINFWISMDFKNRVSRNCREQTRILSWEKPWNV